MKIFFKVFGLAKDHKIWATILVCILIAVGYFSYSKIFAAPTVTRYVLGTVEKGTLVSSVSGSGQVSAYHQLDLKPKVSGDITYVGVSEGDEVRAGTLIAVIDDSIAQKAVRDAEANLVSAKISLQKTNLQSVQSVDQANTDLKKAYDDSFTYIADAFIDLPSLVSDTGDILYNPNHSSYMDNGRIQQFVGNGGVDYKYKIIAQFESAKKLYEASLGDYRSTDRNSDPVVVEKLASETQAAVKALGDTIKNINNVIDYIAAGVTQKTSEMTADQSSLNTYISKLDSSFNNLVAVQKSITTAKNNIASANQSFSQSNLLNSNVPIDVQSAELAVTQKQNALIDAKENLADYYIRAPFDGVIASVGVKKADPASSATAIATIITKQQIATITLNEIDAAKVKVGQKATLTFDALSELSIEGKVLTIDAVGTVTQGVVNYTVEIGLDKADERIKTGMSVSANIITSEKQDVLLVPSSAIKTLGKKSSVQMLDAKYDKRTAQAGIISSTAPKSVAIEIGDSNDTDTEVLSGLIEGDQIVVRTVVGAQALSSASGTVRTNTGIFGTSGGATRIPR